MKLSTFLTINAILVFLFGLGFLFMPETVMSLYGAELSRIGAATAQLLGAAFLGFGIIRWLARNSKETGFLNAIVFAAFIEDSIGFVILLKGQLAGLSNANGWSNVVLYGLFALGFGFFHFQKKR